MSFLFRCKFFNIFCGENKNLALITKFQAISNSMQRTRFIPSELISTSASAKNSSASSITGKPDIKIQRIRTYSVL